MLGRLSLGFLDHALPNQAGFEGTDCVITPTSAANRLRPQVVDDTLIQMPHVVPVLKYCSDDFVDSIFTNVLPVQALLGITNALAHLVTDPLCRLRQ